MLGASLGALLAAFADPYLAGFAVNNVVPYTCGDSHGALGDTLACCQLFDCNTTGGFQVAINASDEEYYLAQLAAVPTNEVGGRVIPVPRITQVNEVFLVSLCRRTFKPRR